MDESVDQDGVISEKQVEDRAAQERSRWTFEHTVEKTEKAGLRVLVAGHALMTLKHIPDTADRQAELQTVVDMACSQIIAMAITSPGILLDTFDGLTPIRMTYNDLAEKIKTARRVRLVVPLRYAEKPASLKNATIH